MQQDWHEEQHPSSKCISDLRDRLSQVYDLATEAAQKARQKQKEGYDIKIRGAVIKQGDGVLLKVVSFDGRQMGTDPTEPRLKKRFALFDLLKSLYSDTKILSKYIPSLQRRW